MNSSRSPSPSSWPSLSSNEVSSFTTDRQIKADRCAFKVLTHIIRFTMKLQSARHQCISASEPVFERDKTFWVLVPWFDKVQRIVQVNLFNPGSPLSDRPPAPSSKQKITQLAYIKYHQIESGRIVTSLPQVGLKY